MVNLEREYKRLSDKWMNAYKQVSALTGIKLEDTVRYGFCLVKKGKLAGEIGIYQRSEYPFDYFKFKRKIIGFDSRKEGIDYIWTTPIILLEERRKMLLF